MSNPNDRASGARPTPQRQDFVPVQPRIMAASPGNPPPALPDFKTSSFVTDPAMDVYLDFTAENGADVLQHIPVPMSPSQVQQQQSSGHLQPMGASVAPTQPMWGPPSAAAPTLVVTSSPAAFNGRNDAVSPHGAIVQTGNNPSPNAAVLAAQPSAPSGRRFSGMSFLGGARPAGAGPPRGFGERVSRASATAAQWWRLANLRQRALLVGVALAVLLVI